MAKTSTGLKNKWLGAAANSGSLQTLLDGGMMEIYSGAAPADADAAETGVLLLSITLASAAFTPGDGVSVNGLTWEDAVAGVLAKLVAETWSGVGVAAGVAGYARFYNDEQVKGASSVAERIDLTVGTVGTEVIMTSTTVAIGVTSTVTAAQLNF